MKKHVFPQQLGKDSTFTSFFVVERAE